MGNKQAITIRQDAFVCNIYDVRDLMRLTLTDVRKLWKIMFSAKEENWKTIITIKNWLHVFVAECAERNAQEEAVLTAAKADAAQMHAILSEDNGGADLKRADQAIRKAQKRVRSAKADHVKAQKLLTIFNELVTK